MCFEFGLSFAADVNANAILEILYVKNNNYYK